MSSQSEDDQENKRDQSNHNRSCHASIDANNNHPLQAQPSAPPQPNNNQSPPHGYPPAMGYPPQMLYPHGGQYPSGYPPGPPPPHGYNHYPYVQVPPGATYYNQGYPTTQSERCARFARGLLAAMIILVVLTFLSSLLTWVILRPEIPVFHVENMSVSNFNTSTPFTATWSTTVSVKNPNHKLRVYFDKIMGAIFYDEENQLGTSWLNPVFIKTKSNTTMDTVISAGGSAENAVPIWVTEEMSKDREKGLVTFSLRFRIWATFKSGSWWSRNIMMRVVCEDLKVNLVNGSGNGTLAPGERDDCGVYA